jgi:hypothetical protein
MLCWDEQVAASQGQNETQNASDHRKEIEAQARSRRTHNVNEDKRTLR